MTDPANPLLNEALRLKSEMEQVKAAPTVTDLAAEARKLRSEQSAAALRQTAIEAKDSNPDTAARALTLGKQTGLPPAVVERNMPEVERKAEFDRLSRVAEDPAMSAFVTDPTNYRIARDDLDTLQSLSDLARSLPAGAVKGFGSVASGGGALIDAGARSIDRGVRGLFGDRVADAFWFEGPNPSTGLMAGGDFLKEIGADIAAPQERQNIGTDIAEGVGQLAQQILTLIVTGGTAGTTMLFAQGADQQREKQDKQGVYGRDMGTDAALFAGGAVTALTEKYGLDYLMRKVPEPVRNAVLGKIWDVMKSAGNEAAQEVVEGILQNVVEYAFYNPDAEILQDFSREAGAAGGAAAVVRSMILAATGGKRAGQHKAAVDQAARDAEAMQQINTLASESKLRERSPEKFREFVAGLVQGDRAVEIDAQTAVTLFQDQPDLTQFMTAEEAQALQRDVAIAQETGGDVRMPLATFIGAFAGHEQFAELAENVRVQEDAPTAREAAEWSPEELENQVRMLRDDVASAVGQQNAAQQIFDDMHAQLKAAAVDDVAATKYAAVVAARVRTRAERLGVDPWELYSDQRPIIRRELVGAKNIDNVTLTLDDMRAKVRISDRAAYGPSMLEAVAAQGGIVDTGGDFKSMDADKWHRGKVGRKPLIRQALRDAGPDMLGGEGTNKNGVDVVARDMQAQGYIDPGVSEDMLVPTFMELFGQELAGKPVYSDQNRNDRLAGRIESMRHMDEFLNYAGLDLATATDEQVRAALDKYAKDTAGSDVAERVLSQPQPEKQTRNLVVMHNLKPEAVLHAAKMGGLPVPSLAVANKDIGFDGYGSVSLIGDPRMVDPKADKAVKAFDADVYSPRYPGVNYEVDYKAWRKVDGDLAALAKQIDQEFSASDLEDKGVRAIRESALWQAKFLSEKGQQIEVVKNDKGRVDRWDTQKKISEALKPYEGEFSDWADQQANALISKEKIFDGFTNAGNRKYLPHNLDTVVRILKRGLRAGESFNYGVGTIRSNYAKQFRSLKAIQDKRGSIVSQDAMRAVKDELSNDFIALSDKLRDNYKFDAKSFRYMDDLSQVLGEIATRGRAPLNEAFENLSDEQNQAIADFLGKLRDAPTEYFEAKVQRAVGLNEFAGALVPKGVNPRVVETLKAAGLRVVEYDGAEDRTRALGEFQQQFFQREGNTPRGSIQFLPNGQSIISLTGKADLSTFLHEMGHGWLEEMKSDASRTDVPPDISHDWERIAKYLGIDPEVDVIPTEAHEKFARTAEAYFMEGKAPSLELASAFERFKAWLLRIYRTVRDLNVPINDDIRGVFDRMLATDAEIAQAQEQYRFTGMFNTAKEAGLTDAEFARYRDLAAKARQEAEQSVTAKLQREAERINSEEYKEAREAIGNEVEAQIKAEPVYQVIHYLQTGKMLDGSAPPRAGLKLDRKVLKAEYGGKIVKRLPKDTVSTGGAPPEMIATLFGFTSADEMVKAMLNAPPMQAEMQSRIEQRLKEQFPDPLKDGRAHEMAIEALHGDAQLRVLEAEFRALKRLGAGQVVEAAVRRKLSGMAAPSVADVQAGKVDQAESEAMRMGPGADARSRAEAATGRMATDATAKVAKAARTDQAKARKVAVDALRVDRKAIEAAAESIVGSTKVGDLLNTNKWRRAEKASAQAVVEAVAARKYGDAAWHQRQRIINAYLVQRSLKAREEIDGAIDKFNKYLSKKAPKSIDPDYLDKARTVLQAYQFGPQLSDRKRTILALREINRWEQAKAEDERAMLQIAPEVLAADEKTHYRDMTVSEFAALRDTVENIVTVGRTKNRLLRNEGERDLNRRAALVGETIRQNVAERSKSGRLTETTGDKIKNFIGGYFAAHRKIEFLARELDGFADLGPVWQTLFKPLQAAQNVETRMSIKATTEFRKLFEKFPAEARARWRTKLVYYPEIGRSATKAEIIGLALNWGNEGNREAIRKGHKWNDAQVKALLDKAMTREDWEFVQSAWDMIDGYWPELAALERRVKGVTPQKVEPSEVVTPHGTFKGGYYPLKYNANESERAYAHSVDKMASQLMSGFVAKASTRSGAAIERVGSGGMPVRLDLGVMFEHVAEVIHDVSHREAVLDVNRLLDHSDIKGAVLDTKGPKFHRAMKDWVRDIAAGDVPALTTMDQIISHLRAGVSISAMGWKLTTAMVQPTGLLQAVPRVGVAPLVKAVAGFYSNPMAMRDKTAFIYERSAEMRTRAEAMDRDIRDALKRTGPDGGKIADLKRSFFYLTGLMDMGVAVPIWSAAYEKGMDKFGGDEAKAVDYADHIVRTTQASGLPKDLAQIQRGAPIYKMFTAFYSYFSVTYNMMADEMKQLKRPRDFPRFAANVAFLTFLPAVLSELMMGKGPDAGDDDEEGWAKWMAATTLKYGMSGFVGLRDIVSALGSNFGYAGSPVGAVAESAVKLGKQIGEGDADRALAKAAVDTAGPILHLPSRQMWTTAEGLYLWADGADINPFEILVTRDSRKFQ